MKHNKQMKSDLFDVALSQCDIIKEDLERQDEKLEEVEGKLKSLSKKINISKEVIERCGKTCLQYKWIYIILGIFLVTIFIIKK